MQTFLTVGDRFKLRLLLSLSLGYKDVYTICAGRNTRNYIQYFLTLVFFTFVHVVF